MKHILTLIVALFTGLSVLAQHRVSGVVKDAQTGETLIGANVLYGENLGVVTDLDGKYEFTVNDGTYNLTFSYVGYKTQIKTITVKGEPVTVNVSLKQDILDEVTLVADIAQERLTPVAFTSISPKKITEELGGRDLPLVLNQTPGVFATQSGGGDGDARINIRGFKQENMAVLIDGIPVNDMENGAVYWSNWFGLDAITTRMQVQRGLSASKLSIPSVGGTINILTTNADNKKFFKVKQDVNQFGKSTTSLGYNSGLSDKGWNFTGAFTYKKGDNYADNSNVEGMFLYGKVTKKFKNHIFSASSFMAPQEHDQRTSKQYIISYDLDYAVKHGVDTSLYASNVPRNLGREYNRNWGYLKRRRYNNDVETEVLSEKKNFYNKPQFNLNHTWLVNSDLKINTAAYLSIGRGGGTRFQSSIGDQYYTEDGLIDWQKIYDANALGEGIPFPNVDEDGNRISSIILAAGRNDHNWYGVLSKVDYDLNDSWNLSGGLDLRSYEGRHYREVYDLLGGDYYIEEGTDNKLTKGDRYFYDNSTFVKWAGVFTQAEYTSGALTGFVNLSGSRISFKREDYLIDEESEVKSKLGGTFKAGANYNLNEKSNVFMNVGVLTRARPSSFVFNGFGLTYREDTSNEKVNAVELGYHFGSKKFTVNVNGYYTMWLGKPLRNKRLDDGLDLVLEGLDARHMGIEVDAIYKLTPKFDVQTTLSLGDWRWVTKDAKGSVYDRNVDAYTGETLRYSFNDIPVGDAPQQQLGISLNYKPFKGFYVRAKGAFNAKYYSDFSLDRASENDDGELVDPAKPWRVPNFYTIDLFAGYNFDYKGHRITWNFSLYNVLDEFYISDATDNDNGSSLIGTSNVINNAPNSINAASVFFGAGRNFSTSLKITF